MNRPTIPLNPDDAQRQAHKCAVATATSYLQRVLEDQHGVLIPREAINALAHGTICAYVTQYATALQRISPAARPNRLDPHAGATQ